MSSTNRAVTPDERRAYLAGYDAGQDGPDTTNCHYGLFHRREMTRMWELGKRVGEQHKARGVSTR